MLRTSYVLDTQKKVFTLRFLRTGEIKFCTFGTQLVVCTYSSYEELPNWIKRNMDNEEVLQVIKQLRK